MKLFKKREEGQGLVEYALLLVLVAVVVIGILMMLGDQISGVFAQIAGHLGGGVSVVNVSTTPSGPGKVNLTVKVTAVRNTTLSITANGKAGSSGVSCNSGQTCSLTVTNTNASGSYTITASPGGTTTGTY